MNSQDEEELRERRNRDLDRRHTDFVRNHQQAGPCNDDDYRGDGLSAVDRYIADRIRMGYTMSQSEIEAIRRRNGG